MGVFGFADKALHLAGKRGIVNIWPETTNEYITHHEQFCCTPPADSYIADTLALLPNVSGLKGLDAGCGAGILTQKLVQKGAVMHVSDISIHSVNHAFTMGAVGGKQSSIEKLPFLDGEFDFCICTDVIEHVVDFDAALDELIRVTKKSGFILISLPNANSTQVILIDLIFPIIKGILFKLIGRDAPRPSRGHIHLLSPADVKDTLSSRGLVVSELKLAHWADTSRNKFIVNTITSIVGLFIPASKQASMILRVDFGGKC